MSHMPLPSHYGFGPLKQAVYMPASPGSREGSFSMGVRQVAVQHPRLVDVGHARLTPPVTQHGWSPGGMGEMTSQEKMTAALAAITAIGGTVSQAIIAPQLAKQQRKLDEAQARLDEARAAERGETFRQLIKTGGMIALAGIAVTALSAGAVKLARRRRRRK